MRYSIELVSISTIVEGDTVDHGGVLMTVGKGNLKASLNHGLSLFGDCYALGYKKVKLAIIEVA